MNNVQPLDQKSRLPAHIKFIIFKNADLDRATEIIWRPIPNKDITFCCNNIYGNNNLNFSSQISENLLPNYKQHKCVVFIFLFAMM
jgi:hypothetical protein